MSNYNDMLSGMRDALSGGATMQSSVRKYIEEDGKGFSEADTATGVAHAVTEFKNDMMRSIPAMSDQAEKAYIKKMDNIINDVSRITREALGYSVVCKKRGNVGKGRYWEYAAEIPKPRATASSKYITGPAPVPAPCTMEHFDNTKHTMIPRTSKEAAQVMDHWPVNIQSLMFMDSEGARNPETTVKWLLDRGYDAVGLGKAIAVILTAKKES